MRENECERDGWMDGRAVRLGESVHDLHAAGKNSFGDFYFPPWIYVAFGFFVEGSPGRGAEGQEKPAKTGKQFAKVRRGNRER